ncbi:hypothetical protein ACP275_08G069500 [Erythranthe tilingii]
MSGHIYIQIDTYMDEASCKYHMIGGDGPNSYAHNSVYQKELIVSAEDLTNQLINSHLDTNKPPFDPRNTFRIADLGCSVGPNTFFAVENIIKSIEKKYKKSNQTTQNPNNNHQTPEFQVFFNDLINNDFNTLFKNNNLLTSKKSYFIAGVPGSFHSRLFPKESIHFAHCSTALHWLSRIPEEVRGSGSMAWNKGRVHYFGAREEVKEAYSVRYKKDMDDFLSFRARELVDGGLMVMVVLGFPDGVVASESSMGVAFGVLGSCFEELAKMGKISREKVDSFNLPFYYPSPLELKALIEANGMFDIVRIAKLAAPMRVKPDPQIVTAHLRAVIGELIEEHFGRDEISIDELFKLHLQKVTNSPELFDEKYWKETNYFVFLKRK